MAVHRLQQLGGRVDPDGLLDLELHVRLAEHGPHVGELVGDANVESV